MRTGAPQEAILLHGPYFLLQLRHICAGQGTLSAVQLASVTPGTAATRLRRAFGALTQWCLEQTGCSGESDARVMAVRDTRKSPCMPAAPVACCLHLWCRPRA